MRRAAPTCFLVAALVAVWPGVGSAQPSQAPAAEPLSTPVTSQQHPAHEPQTPAPAQPQGHPHHPAPAPESCPGQTQAPAHAHDAPLGGAVPPITDEDRAAAFPDVEGHTLHDRAVHYQVLMDQFEWSGRDGGVTAWDNTSWIGGDVHRAWFRTEGDVLDGHVDAADVHVLYGKAISPWWDLVGGVRQDMRPGPARTWAAFGIQGLAPYWFGVQATGYVGAEGRTHARVEVEYELLLTNRLVLQPLVEVEMYGKADPERRIGAGISSLETGLRLRYEIRREIAPYVGLSWERAFGGTADFARDDGESVSHVRPVVGLRVWF